MLDRCSPTFASTHAHYTRSFAAASSSSAAAFFLDRLRPRRCWVLRYGYRRYYCYRAHSQPVDGSAAAAARRRHIDPLLQPLHDGDPPIDGATFISRSDIESCQWLLPAGNHNEVDPATNSTAPPQQHVHHQLLREPGANHNNKKTNMQLEPSSADAAPADAIATTTSTTYGAHLPFPAAISDDDFEKRNAISSAYGCCFGPSYATAAAAAAASPPPLSAGTAARVVGEPDFLRDAVPFQFDFSAAADGSAGTLLPWQRGTENRIERAIFDFRFFSLLAVGGSLVGAFLCFLKGCVYIMDSYAAFYNMCSKGVHTGMVVLRLVEAVDVYLTGTVMLIFGMGLYGLFISNVSNNVPPHEDRALRNSSLFGMFVLRKRPKWMRIASLEELKSKLGHVVVMILLVKMFERSKAICIATSVDLLTYSICIFLISSALLVLRNISHHDH